MQETQVDTENFNLKKRPDETVFEYTQRIRLAVVENLTEGGIPTEDGLENLGKFLDAMDKQEATKTKIEMENDAQQSDKKAQEIIANLIGLMGNSNPYESEVNTGRVVEHVGELAEVTLVPGELDSNQRVLNYDSFMKEYREKNPRTNDDDEE